MDWISNPEIWVALLTLTALEIVLGVDNIIFVSVLVGRLPAGERAVARRVGLSLAMLVRIGLLFAITWVIGLTQPLFSLFSHEFSGRDLILLMGGLFLLAKGTYEIHDKLEGDDEHGATGAPSAFAGVIIQIVLLDVVFSLDSVITAVGMVDQIAVMIAAIVIAVSIMLAAAAALNAFVDRHPTIKMLALSFLMLIGLSLTAEGLGQPIPKGYIYFAIAFSVFVELLNLRVRGRARKPVELHQSYVTAQQAAGQDVAQ